MAGQTRCKGKGAGDMNKQDRFNHQFKERKNNGEKRNGRLAQFKNHNAEGGEEPNEYISKKED